MQLRELLKCITEKLNTAGIDASTYEAGVIICHCLNVDRAYLFAHPEKELDEGVLQQILHMTEKRCSRIPLQQLQGIQEFMSLSFFVDENVLIPRQDTEVLVETIMEYAKKNDHEISILDIGTGSGCIAVSLAKYLEKARLTAVDVSEAALSVARRNAEANGVTERVRFLRSDLFSELSSEKKYNIIISNPPYIPTEDIRSLQPEVKEYEPMLALDGGSDGLDFYRRIIAQSKSYLQDKGLLAFEVGIYQAELVNQILCNNGFSDIKIIKDLAGIDRVVYGTFTLSRDV